jgi:phospholipase C
MRRILLIAAAAAACPLAWIAACSSSSSRSSTSSASECTNDAGLAPDGQALTPCAWDQSVTRVSDSTSATNRAACTYKRGDMPAATLGPSIPIDQDMPIDNIVVVMMENHSFDSYLGHLNAYAHRTDIESAEAGASNPTVDGGTAPWTHGPHPCSADTDHSWGGTHREIDNGKMDGFAVDNQGYNAPPDAGSNPGPLYDGARSMWWYDHTDLPFYYQLASTFAVADHYHCSVPGPTYPNRMYLFAATSFGQTCSTCFPNISAYPYPQNDASVLDELEKRHVTWNLYTDGPPGAATIYVTSVLNRWGRDPLFSFAQFQKDAAAGTLPQVSFVDPNLGSETNGGAGTDEHPPGDIQSGELFVSQVVQAVTTSPQWAHTALFITHDENGGFYDHVPPPPACAPDGIAPILVGSDQGTQGGFDMYGIRVLLVAVSPYAKKGYVGHEVYDHTSLTRFIEAKFKIPALTARDANALPPTDLFDFTAPPAFATPPQLTMPTIDQTQLQYCESTYPK